MSLVYLNNAATSYPKPECVTEIAVRKMNALPSGQFRSAGILDDGDVFTECRQRIGHIIGTAEADRIFFSSGATESLNAIFIGLGINATEIITTVTEHNSVLRPLYNLPDIKGEPVLLPCDVCGRVDPERFEAEAKKGRTKVLVLNHCSNVNGTIQDAGAFGEIAAKYGIFFILDASQSAGCIPVYADEWRVDALAFTGHKSMLGLQGTGGYYIRSGIPFQPMRYGGTGLDSSRIRYDDGVYEYETGTQNAMGIAALSEAAGYILDTGIENIADREHSIREYTKERLEAIPGVHIIPAADECGPVISLVSDMLMPSDLAYILQNSYEIVTRAGLMCAPLIHKYIGSGDNGTVRVSFSCFQTTDDIDRLAEALREIHDNNG